MSSIHASAVIDQSAEIGQDVQIGPFCYIGPNVKIGRGCRLHSHVCIECNTELGPENEIFQFASLGAKPQDLKYRGEPSTLVLGARNQVRECVTLHRGTEGGGMRTVIGNSNLFMANSHVAHDCLVGDHNVVANSVALAGHVTLMDHIVVGGLAGIHQFTRLGSYAFIGAGAMVSLDVAPYCIAQGDRAYVRGLNLIGLQRAGFSAEQITDIKKAFRLLFMTTGQIKTRAAEIPAELAAQDHVKVMLDFVAGTQRGLTSLARDHQASETE